MTLEWARRIRESENRVSSWCKSIAIADDFQCLIFCILYEFQLLHYISILKLNSPFIAAALVPCKA
jgi:hypothetical protein